MTNTFLLLVAYSYSIFMTAVFGLVSIALAAAVLIFVFGDRKEVE